MARDLHELTARARADRGLEGDNGVASSGQPSGEGQIPAQSSPGSNPQPEQRTRQVHRVWRVTGWESEYVTQTQNADGSWSDMPTEQDPLLGSGDSDYDREELVQAEISGPEGEDLGHDEWTDVGARTCTTCRATLDDDCGKSLGCLHCSSAEFCSYDCLEKHEQQQHHTQG